jgi:hypothetical protein
LGSSYQGAVGSDCGDNLFAGNLYFQGDTTLDVFDGSLTLSQGLNLLGTDTDCQLTIRGGGALDLRDEGDLSDYTVIQQYATLLANNTTGSATGLSQVTVNADGTLGGEGIIAGPVVVDDGGIIAPGNDAAGELTLAEVTLSSASLLDFELYNQPLSSMNDHLVVTGDLILDGLLDISLLDPNMDPQYLDGYYNVIRYHGQLDDRGLEIGNVPTGWVCSIDTAVQPGWVLLNMQPVPEPFTLVLLGLGGFAVLRHHRG